MKFAGDVLLYETKIVLSTIHGGKNGEAFNQMNNFPTVKYGGGSIMFVGMFYRERF